MKNAFSLLYFFLILSLAQAQEICNNCIDDDGDGKIDCLDESCVDSCGGQFLYSLDEPQRCIDSFQLEQLWRTSGIYGTSNQVIGDITNSGIPEVLSEEASGILVMIDGATGTLINQTTSVGRVPAIADVDGDKLGDIFVVDGTTLSRLDFSFGTIWSQTIVGISDFMSISDADLNGTSELIVRGMVMDAASGAILIDSPGIIESTTGNNGMKHIVADLLPDNHPGCSSCDGLELLTGKSVYSIDLINQKFELISSAPSYVTRGINAIADMDGDGMPDIISNAVNMIYVWDPRTQDVIGDIYFYTPFKYGGIPLVGNFDKDPEPEVGIESGDAYILLDNDLTLKWSNSSLQDITSGGESAVAFDFDCDGILEIVHRGDDGFLDIVRGTDGMILSRDVCNSATGEERPSIADVNADGHVDIVCGCNEGLTAWSGAPNDWIAGRSVSNQYAYQPLSINDNLQISCVSYPNYNDTSLPAYLNGFMIQAPMFTQEGEYCIFEKTERELDNIDIEDISLCEDEEELLSLNLPDYDLLWQTPNQETYSNSITIQDSGKYKLSISDTLNCKILTDSFYVAIDSCDSIATQSLIIFIPNAITPHGDFNNDHLQVLFSDAINHPFDIYIYDRWGKLKAFAQNNDDLKEHSKQLQTGIYSYRLIVQLKTDKQQKSEFSGNLTVF